jgi:hypothetical protein
MLKLVTTTERPQIVSLTDAWARAIVQFQIVGLYSIAAGCELVARAMERELRP